MKSQKGRLATTKFNIITILPNQSVVANSGNLFLKDIWLMVWPH